MPKRLRESGSSKKGICSILGSSVNWDIWHKHQVRTPKVRTTPMSSDPVHTSPHPYGGGSNHERILVALLRKMFSLARDWGLYLGENPATRIQFFREDSRDRRLTRSGPDAYDSAQRLCGDCHKDSCCTNDARGSWSCHKKRARMRGSDIS